MPACLLSYALTTVPTPLTASPGHVDPGNEDELSYGSVDIVVSNSGSTPIRCSRIALVMRVGRLAQDLALTGEGIAPYVEPSDAWTIVGPQPDVLVAVPSAETAVFPAAGDSSTIRFSVEPTSGLSEVTVDGLCITLDNIVVSDKCGVSYIEIEEWAAKEGDNIPDDPNTATLEVAKFPFRSGADPAPGVGRALVAVESVGGPPATRIAAGVPVRLEWHHVRGDSHELYMDGERVSHPSIVLGSAYDVPAGTVLRDVAVALKTSTPTPDGGFVTRWDHLTVCVTDQRLDSLDVTNTLTAHGPVWANHQLTVSDTLTAQAAIQANGTLTTEQTLTAKGHIDAKSTLTVSDTLTVAGPLAGVSVVVNRLPDWTGSWKESSNGWHESGTNQVMVGRNHDDDENGRTWHRYANLQVRGARTAAYPSTAPAVHDTETNEATDPAH
ncbi:hypothetical protein ACFYN3_28125 [Streptomyces lavendulae]|uniref:hypothetical protein n=1 Tax=Streptomyces lavendulae TaxID=1914 RepID=UPI00368B26B0